MTDQEFAGRTILITGAAGGLGCACAQAFTLAGGTVVLCDLPTEKLQKSGAELAELAPGRVHTVGLDLSDHANCANVPQLACEAAGVRHLDVLVNGVGVMKTLPFDQLTIEQWTRTIDINLTGIFATIQAASRVMREGSSIVTLSSVAGRSGRPLAADYSAAKTALLSLTKSLALYFGPKIRVNAVCPGMVLTPMWEAIMRDRDAEFGAGAGAAYLEEIASRSPLGRAGEPNELASAVAFLASDRASFITGQALNVDGGLEMN